MAPALRLLRLLCLALLPAALAVSASATAAVDEEFFRAAFEAAGVSLPFWTQPLSSNLRAEPSKVKAGAGLLIGNLYTGNTCSAGQIGSAGALTNTCVNNAGVSYILSCDDKSFTVTNYEGTDCSGPVKSQNTSALSCLALPTSHSVNGKTLEIPAFYAGVSCAASTTVTFNSNYVLAELSADSACGSSLGYGGLQNGLCLSFKLSGKQYSAKVNYPTLEVHLNGNCGGVSVYKMSFPPANACQDWKSTTLSEFYKVNVAQSVTL